MAVVIDEMQLDAGHPPPQQQQRGGGGGEEGGGSGGGEQPSPEDVERMWRQRHERHERVRAY